jgi:glycosyltransferase involved in cell wall biosynthesis
MEWPRITLVTTSYNHGRFIGETLESVLSQGYPNLEYIVIDGGSTDESVGVIQRYGDRLSYWVSEPDRGETDAVHKGLSRATGDILGWLASDDIHEPWTLKEVAQFFMENPKANVVYGDLTWIDTKSRVIKHKKEHPFNRFIWMYDHNFIPQPSTFWRRALYERVGGFNPAFDLAMDADLWVRFADASPIHHVRRVWSRMRLYAEQKNQRLRWKSNLEDLEIRSRYGFGAEPVWSRRAKKAVAKSMRVTWKLVTGCYW